MPQSTERFFFINGPGPRNSSERIEEGLVLVFLCKKPENVIWVGFSILGGTNLLFFKIFFFQIFNFL